MRFRSLVALVAVLLVLTACGDDDAGLPIGDSSTTSSTTTTAATTTTEATTTTAAATTAATTTTAAPLPAVQFLPGGLGFASFGESPDSVLATATLLFGPSTSDSGWLPGGFGDYGVCPGTQFRQVTFGNSLMLMFSDVDYFVGGGVDNFVHYNYSSPTNTMLTAGPPASIDVGVTVAQLLTLWPTAVVEGDDPLYGNVFYYDPGAATFDYLFGTLTGTAPGDTIRYISGGVGCGE